MLSYENDGSLNLEIARFSQERDSKAQNSIHVRAHGTVFSETREKEPSSVMIDLFALGSPLCEILTGKAPYEVIESHGV